MNWNTVVAGRFETVSKRRRKQGMYNKSTGGIPQKYDREIFPCNWYGLDVL